MGETFYFSHDYTARSDVKIKSLIRKHGFVGYGIYWALVEDLYINENSIPANVEDIAHDYRVEDEVIRSILNDFGLFVVTDGNLSSNSVQRRLDLRNEKSLKASLSAKKRWDNANALPPQSDSNAIKESKIKESKENNDSEEAIASPDPVPTNPDFLRFVAWQKENAPTLLTMKEPFTEAQFDKLKKKYHYSRIVDICQRMHNNEPLKKKYKSAYLTFLNCVKLDEK